MARKRVLVYSPQDVPLFELGPDHVHELRRVGAINAEHSLTITTTTPLEKNQRILTRDGTGKWHEHVVTGIDEAHQQGRRLVGTYYAVWSLQHDLMGTYTTRMPGTGGHLVSASEALECALDGTGRWQVGTVTVTHYASASFYYKSGWKALSIVVGTWGGEVDARIEVGLTGVVSRHVDLLAHMGSSVAARRFDYRSDLVGIRRKVADSLVTPRIVPRGKAQETEGGGYGRRTTIESVNGGVEWLQDDESAAIYRVPDGSGGWEYPVQVIETDDYDDPADLKEWALGVKEQYTRPQVTYEASVLQLSEAGMDVHGIALGDEAQCVDREFGEAGLRISGRVVRLEVNELDPTDTRVTIGYLKDGVSGILGDLSARVDGIYDTVQANIAYLSTADYLDALLQRLNDEINVLGGYTYITQGFGIRTYDVAVSDPTDGTDEASSVVEIKGGAIRIANSKTAQGDWDWKTVFVSGHVLADLITAAHLTAGYIGSAESGNYWNLDTGQFRMAATATLGGRTVQNLIDGVDATITSVDVEYAQNQSSSTAPSTGWSTTAPAWQDGHYIWQRTATTTAGGTSYSTPVMISGRDGIDGQNGTNGTSITVASVQYGTSASASTEPASWSTTAPPSVSQGSWLWVKTTYSDSTTTTTKTYQGEDGANGTNGTNGTDGVGISSTTIEYGTSTNGSTQPSSWSSTVPSVSQGQWLWVRTTIAYTNGSSSTSYSKSYVGTDGSDGASVYVLSSTKSGDTTTVVLTDGTTQTTITIEDGADGTNGTAGSNGYVHTAWANSADGATDFSTSVSTGKTYLGVYTDNTQADSTTPSDYSWSLIKGADGTSVTVSGIEYGTSDSAGTQPSSWSTTVPSSMTKGKWLWVRTTYSDSSTATTKSYVGTDGQDGASVYVQSSTKSNGVTTVVLTDGTSTSTIVINDGEDGTNGTPGTNGLNGYVHVAWATSADGSQGFSTSVSTGKTYIGVYTDNTAADSQTYSDYSWSLIRGADGTNGQDGVGITSIAEEYYLSTSDSTQAGGSWSSTQPTWESGKYIWTRSVITWDTTPATTTTTTPTLAQALTQANSEAAAASAAVTALDTSLDQAEVFNRLTNNGALQGLYMSGGELYINASYLKTGYIGNVSNASYWDLDNGTIVVVNATKNQWNRNEKLKFSTLAFTDTSGWLNTITTAQTLAGLLVGDDYEGSSSGRGNIYIIPNLPASSTSNPGSIGAIASKYPMKIMGNYSSGSGAYYRGCISLGSRYIELNMVYGTGTVYPGVVIGTSSVYLGATRGDYLTSSSGTSSTTMDSALTLPASKNTAASMYRGLSLYGSLSVYKRSDITSATGSKVTLGEDSSARYVDLKVYGAVNVQSSLYVAGSKSRMVDTEDYGNRLLYCYETPAPMFGDVGSGSIGDDGFAFVSIDDVFAETARTDMAYQVFLQKCGPGDLWVSEKHPTHFVVEGTPGLTFDWEVKAHQADFETQRLEDFSLIEITKEEAEVSTPEGCYEEELDYVGQIESLYVT